MGRGSLTHGNVLIFSWDHTLEPGEGVRKSARVSWFAALCSCRRTVSPAGCICWHVQGHSRGHQHGTKSLINTYLLTYCLWGVQLMDLGFLWVWVSWLDSLMSSKIQVLIEAFPTAGIFTEPLVCFGSLVSNKIGVYIAVFPVCGALLIGAPFF